MRPLRSLLVYLIAVFLGGALVAPWLYRLVQVVLPGSSLAGNPFHRYVDRSLLGVALLGIWPLVRGLGLKSWREVGVVKPSGQWSRLGNGFALGFGSLALVAALAVLLHAREFAQGLTPARFAGGLVGAAGTAAAVSVLEELLFRGALFTGFRKICDWRAALLVSSMIYAIVHFLAKADVAGPIVWYSGLQLLPLKLRGFMDVNAIMPGFFSLTLAGGMLGYAYQKTGTLYFSIGLHGGWIFWRSFYGLLTQPAPGVSEHFWGSGKLFDGWLALIVLSVLFLFLLRFPPGKPGETSS